MGNKCIYHNCLRPRRGKRAPPLCSGSCRSGGRPLPSRATVCRRLSFFPTWTMSLFIPRGIPWGVPSGCGVGGVARHKWPPGLSGWTDVSHARPRGGWGSTPGRHAGPQGGGGFATAGQQDPKRPTWPKRPLVSPQTEGWGGYSGARHYLGYSHVSFESHGELFKSLTRCLAHSL